MIDAKNEKKERCILVGVSLNNPLKEQHQNSLSELARLADTAGAEVVHTVHQNLAAAHPKFYIGKGKAEQIKRFADELSVNLIVFDDELTPAQTKNLQNLLNVKVVDRAALILDVFSKHARTKEAKTQIELAQLQYILPRLSRMWLHLERQMGGIGARGGPGETQIEIDRRLIRDKISKLKKDLKKIELQRSTRKSRRKDAFLIVLAGYTNAGKSTLMRALTGADVLIQDKLFATLDTTIRTIPELADQKALLIDTVGFIRKLPHSLVASFHSTLEIVKDADLILKVADISDPDYQEQLKTVDHVLAELDAGTVPSRIVMNKVDLLDDDTKITEAKHIFENPVIVSAAQNVHTNKVLEAIKDEIGSKMQTVIMQIDAGDGKTIAQIHANTEVLAEHFTDSNVEIKFRCSPAFASAIRKQINS